MVGQNTPGQKVKTNVVKSCLKKTLKRAIISVFDEPKVYLPYLWRPDNLCTPRRTSTITIIIIAASGKLLSIGGATQHPRFEELVA